MEGGNLSLYVQKSSAGPSPVDFYVHAGLSNYTTTFSLYMICDEKCKIMIRKRSFHRRGLFGLELVIVA